LLSALTGLLARLLILLIWASAGYHGPAGPALVLILRQAAWILRILDVIPPTVVPLKKWGDPVMSFDFRLVASRHSP
jgi:hypothetical protein